MTICGTGHRPNSLGGYAPAIFERLVALASSHLAADRPTKVISGMALGWDQALARAAIELDIPTHAYVPCRGQESRWPLASREVYQEILMCCTVRYVTEGSYSQFCMETRNRAMVDDSDSVLALWNGGRGGTGNCVAYARKVDKPIVNLWDIWEFEL